MPRRILVAALVIAVVSIGIGVGAALAAFALLPAQSGGEPQPSAVNVGRAGFERFELGGLIVEVGLSQQADDTRLVVAAFAGGKPVTGGVDIRGTLTRPLSAAQSLRFVVSGTELVSSQTIAKPHVFDVALKASWKGQSASFVYVRNEGVVWLNARQLRAAGVTIASARAGNVVSTLQLPGEIRFNEDRTAHVVPRVGGVVEQVPVAVGAKVVKGQVLAVLASPELADRRSELLTAQRRLSAARAAYDREHALWRERISAEQDYLQAQVQLHEAEITVRSAREKLAALEAPVSSRALNRYELRAPFAGVIVEKHATAGEAVAAGTNVFTLSDLSTVWAEMAVNAQQLRDVRVGRDATVTAAAFDSTSTGRIAYVGALLGEATRSAPARVVLPNADGVWRPGMFVNVAVETGRAAVPLAVAKDALQDIDGVPSVFVESERGFLAQPVTIGRRDERTVEVLSGLTDGQRYVASNSFALKAELGKTGVEEE